MGQPKQKSGHRSKSGNEPLIDPRLCDLEIYPGGYDVP